MTNHTSGPWRWELNEKHKSMHLVGGKPQYDLTILAPTRWGMNSATLMIRDTAHDGMNLMHKLHERPDWLAPFPGREHHAYWCSAVKHPDMQLIEAAPDLLGAALNALDMLRDARQAFVDCARVRGPRVEDAVAHGLVWIDEETWVEPLDADAIGDHDRALATLVAAIAKATGEQA
jgi:hypothetical protein